METKTFPMTCIICPMGCNMEVTAQTDDDGNITKIEKVSDNGCLRGPQYVEKELFNPTRTLTTTVSVRGGSMPVVPAKTAGEIPKGMLLQAMEVVRRATAPAPIHRGDILIHDILGTGVNLVAAGDAN